MAAAAMGLKFEEGQQPLCHTWMGLRQCREVDVGRRHWRSVVAAAEVVLQQGIVRSVQVSAHAHCVLCAEAG